MSGFILLSIITVSQPAGVPSKLPDDDEISQMLKVRDNFDEGPAVLEKYGDKLFPAYSRLIRSKKLNDGQIACLFSVLAEVKADRSRFVDDAVTALAHQSDLVRRSSLYLLARIGSMRDAAPIAALLADREITVVYRAAQTLCAIGDLRALAALDVWLVNGQGRDVRELREAVTQFRDNLSRRLNSELPVAPEPRPLQR